MLFSEAILIDTSAALAIVNPKDQFFNDATYFYENTKGILWVVINSTTHEAYTRARYNLNSDSAISVYSFLKDESFYQIAFTIEDEKKAFNLLKKYSDHVLSFHDALCAVIMNRYGIYRAFSFDHHFYLFGYEIFPGITK